MRANWPRSYTGRPGAQKSKSTRPTADPSRNTTFSKQTSLWQMIEPPTGSAISSLQTSPDRIEPCRRSMQLGQQRGDRGERRVRSCPRRVRRQRHVPLDELQTLPTVRIDTHRHRRTAEPRAGEHAQVRVHRLGVRVRRPQHVNPDADHPAGVRHAAGQRHLLSDGGPPGTPPSATTPAPRPPDRGGTPRRAPRTSGRCRGTGAPRRACPTAATGPASRPARPR